MNLITCLYQNMSTKRNCKICIIGNQAFSLLNFRSQLIEEMQAKGVLTFALAPDYDDDTRAQVRALGAEPVDFSLSRAGMNPIKDCLDMLKLARLLRQLKPDITLTYFTKPVIYGTLAAWLARVPQRFAMIEGLGYAFTQSEDVQPLRRKVLKSIVVLLFTVALKRVDMAFFMNKDDVNEFFSLQIISPDKVMLLGGIGVDLCNWQSMPTIAKPITFLLAARLLREKGIVEYANAARIIKRKYPDTSFILLGSLDSNPGALCRAEIDAWEKDDILKWPGHVTDVRIWLARTSVFVLPSYREGVPRSTQEAMAMARPVITTDVPGCRETVIEGENGFLVPAHDADALADAMEWFILHPDQIDKMGKASRRIADERFDVHKINRVILQNMGISRR